MIDERPQRVVCSTFVPSWPLPRSSGTILHIFLPSRLVYKIPYRRAPRLACRPSASREQRYLAYNVKALTSFIRCDVTPFLAIMALPSSIRCNFTPFLAVMTFPSYIECHVRFYKFFPVIVLVSYYLVYLVYLRLYTLSCRHGFCRSGKYFVWIISNGRCCQSFKFSNMFRDQVCELCWRSKKGAILKNPGQALKAGILQVNQKNQAVG